MFPKMPTKTEMEESAQAIERRFRLKDSPLGVDGTPIFLKRKPMVKECPPGTCPQDFWSRQVVHYWSTYTMAIAVHRLSLK